AHHQQSNRADLRPHPGDAFGSDHPTEQRNLVLGRGPQLVRLQQHLHRPDVTYSPMGTLSGEQAPHEAA
ncbi:hypothetical protein BN1723_019688, partial [Verticillium longisporum]